MTMRRHAAAPALPPHLLAALGEVVERRTCLHFPPDRWDGLARGVAAAAGAFGYADVAAFAAWLLEDRLTAAQVEELASHLTVGETYFMRSQPTFDALATEVLPGLVRARHDAGRPLRIWSAGCCTGEEPYSLAILLDRLVPAVALERVTILATDINRHFLLTAGRGIFGRWSFRDAPPWLQELYFQPAGDDAWQIVPRIRRMVTFAPLNLAADVYPSLLNDTNAMDLIVCRNVLMYFSPDRMVSVVRRLHNCLVDGGWLVVSPNEVSQSLFAQFETVSMPHATLYRRQRAADLRFRETQPIAPVAADASTPAAALDHARTLYDEGSYGEVVTLLADGPADARSLLLLARAQANQGRLAEALAWCDRFVAAAALDPAGHFLRASILHEQGEVDEAARAYRRALYLDPDFVIAHFALGNLDNGRGRPDEAQRHFRHALHAAAQLPPETVLPESEGVTAGRLAGIIADLLEMEVAHGR